MRRYLPSRRPVSEVFEPYGPLDTLKPIDQDVWIVDGPEIRFNYFGLSLPFPTRMTVIRLPDRGLWIHSPIALSEALAHRIVEAGEVSSLVAPNTLHYWWVADWKSKFPDAKVFAVPGLEERAKRYVPVDEALRDSPPQNWAGLIDQILVRGDVLTEAVFFHRNSPSLVLTDLIENFEPRQIRKPAYRLFLRLFGVTDPDGKAPFDMQLTFWRHRKALRAAVEQMLAWNPERIIIAHGRIYERDGTPELRRAFRWVL